MYTFSIPSVCHMHAYLAVPGPAPHSFERYGWVDAAVYHIYYRRCLCHWWYHPCEAAECRTKHEKDVNLVQSRSYSKYEGAVSLHQSFCRRYLYPLLIATPPLENETVEIENAGRVFQDRIQF